MLVHFAKFLLSMDYVVVMASSLDTRENFVSKAALVFTILMIYGEKCHAAKHFIRFSNFYLFFQVRIAKKKINTLKVTAIFHHLRAALPIFASQRHWQTRELLLLLYFFRSATMLVAVIYNSSHFGSCCCYLISLNFLFLTLVDRCADNNLR